MRFCEQPVTESRISIPGCIVIGARFDHLLLSSTCIASSEIDLPPNIHRSVPRRQAEFLAGRLCARKALELLTGAATIPHQKSDRSPQWPAHVCGSITHNRHRALAVVAQRKDFRALGIDIETPFNEEQCHEIARDILIKAEYERLLGLSKKQRTWLLTLTFSLKESLYKALYPLTGTQFYFEHADLLDWSPDGHARLRLLCDLSDEFPANTEIAGRFCALDNDLLTYVAIPSQL